MLLHRGPVTHLYCIKYKNNQHLFPLVFFSFPIGIIFLVGSLAEEMFLDLSSGFVCVCVWRVRACVCALVCACVCLSVCLVCYVYASFNISSEHYYILQLETSFI